jgi:Tol biopolymer transport system component
MGPEHQCDPTVSADGTWLLYFDLVANRRLVSANPVSLRRVPIAGGPPQLVLNEKGFYIVQCARAPSNLCVVDERQDKQLALYAFDPLRGKGPELIRVDLKAPTVEYNWALSPDGSRIAFLSHGDGPNRILVLPLTGGAPHEIVVEGWDRLLAVHWAADGKGLFVSSQSEGSEALLFVDLKGQPHVLWQQAIWGGWGIPSPDGRYLAFLATTTSSNAWMLEDF